MNRWTRFLGIAGLVVAAFGLVGALVVGSFSQPLMLTHLALGALLILIWFVTAGTTNLGEATAVVRGRTARFGANALLYAAIFLGLLVVINLAGKRYNERWDLTEEGVYSLAPQTERVLTELKAPLTLVGVKDPQAGNDSSLEDLLKLYKSANPARVSVEMLDPRTKPHLLETYELKPGNLVYVEYGEGQKKGVSRINEGSEEALTNAIIKLTRGAARKLYYVEGHDEPDLKGVDEGGVKLFADTIADEHLTVEGLLLAEHGSIPEDAAGVILVSPKRPLPEAERKVLVSYAQAGGRLVMFNDPRTTSTIQEIADQFGIAVGDDVIIDRVQRLFAAPALGAQPIVRDYMMHPITRSLTPQHITIFNIASSVRAKTPAPSDGTVTEFLRTGASAWAEHDLAALFDSADPTATFDAQDLKGPVSLGAAYEKKLGDGEKTADGENPTFQRETRVVVFGDSDFILNANLGVYANRDLAMNALNWIVGEEGGLTIRPKSFRQSAAPIARDTFVVLFVTSFIVPELLLLMGLMIWWNRRTAFA